MGTYSHILLSYEYEAIDVLNLLRQGRDFAELAKRFSMCSSARSGGRLGAIPKGRTHPEFEAAAIELKPGEFTNTPVRTPVGYHIIYRHL